MLIPFVWLVWVFACLDCKRSQKNKEKNKANAFSSIKETKRVPPGLAKFKSKDASQKVSPGYHANSPIVRSWSLIHTNSNGSPKPTGKGSSVYPQPYNTLHLTSITQQPFSRTISAAHSTPTSQTISTRKPTNQMVSHPASNVPQPSNSRHQRNSIENFAYLKPSSTVPIFSQEAVISLLRNTPHLPSNAAQPTSQKSLNHVHSYSSTQPTSHETSIHFLPRNAPQATSSNIHQRESNTQQRTNQEGTIQLAFSSPHEESSKADSIDFQHIKMPESSSQDSFVHLQSTNTPQQLSTPASQPPTVLAQSLFLPTRDTLQSKDQKWHSFSSTSTKDGYQETRRKTFSSWSHDEYLTISKGDVINRLNPTRTSESLSTATLSHEVITRTEKVSEASVYKTTVADLSTLGLSSKDLIAFRISEAVTQFRTTPKFDKTMSSKLRPSSSTGSPYFRYSPSPLLFTEAMKLIGNDFSKSISKSFYDNTEVESDFQERLSYRTENIAVTLGATKHAQQSSTKDGVISINKTSLQADIVGKCSRTLCNVPHSNVSGRQQYIKSMRCPVLAGFLFPRIINVACAVTFSSVSLLMLRNTREPFHLLFIIRNLPIVGLMSTVVPSSLQIIIGAAKPNSVGCVVVTVAPFFGFNVWLFCILYISILLAAQTSAINSNFEVIFVNNVLLLKALSTVASVVPCFLIINFKFSQRLSPENSILCEERFVLYYAIVGTAVLVVIFLNLKVFLRHREIRANRVGAKVDAIAQLEEPWVVPEFVNVAEDTTRSHADCSSMSKKVSCILQAAFIICWLPFLCSEAVRVSSSSYVSADTIVATEQLGYAMASFAPLIVIVTYFRLYRHSSKVQCSTMELAKVHPSTAIEEAAARFR